MIGSGELYDMEDEARKTTDIERLRDIAGELIHDHHRLRGLVEEMAAFRSSKEHDETMKELKAIQETMTGARDEA